MLRWVHPSPHPKQHLDRFGLFSTAHGRRSPYCPFPPQNCPFTWEDPNPHLIHGSLGPPESTTQTATRLFSHFCKAHNHDRLTDHATSVTVGCTYVRSTEMQPNNNNIYKNVRFINELGKMLLLALIMLWLDYCNSHFFTQLHQSSHHSKQSIVDVGRIKVRVTPLANFHKH